MSLAITSAAERLLIGMGGGLWGCPGPGSGVGVAVVMGIMKEARRVSALRREVVWTILVVEVGGWMVDGSEIREWNVWMENVSS